MLCCVRIIAFMLKVLEDIGFMSEILEALETLCYVEIEA